MRNKLNFSTVLVIPLLLSVMHCGIFCQENQTNRLWSAGSAHLLPAGRVEVGIFQPMRYGWSEDLEVSLHPLLFFIMPNLSLKKQLGRIGDYILSSKHSVVYPTLLMRTLAREGTGGIISPEFNIPHMIAVNNALLVSGSFIKKHTVTLKAGFRFAFKSAGLDERTTIDLPLVFPRLAVFYHNYDLHFGFDWQGQIYKRWNFLLDSDGFISPASDENLAFEHKGLIIWRKSKRTEYSLGYKLVFGQYPFGEQWHLLLPMIDIQWGWHW